MSHLPNASANQKQIAPAARMNTKMMKSTMRRTYILGMTSATRGAKD